MNDTCLNKKTSLCLKGILCLCVLLHHLYQFTGLFSNTYFGHFLSFLGQWSVAVFIFISGFGLYSSYASHKEAYIKGFIQKRLLPFYLTYLVFVIIYLVYDYHRITDYNIIIKSLLAGGTIVSFGWYFQLIYILYIGFYLIFRFCKISRLKSALLFLFLSAYLLISILLRQSYIQYIPLASFALGIICAVHSNRVSRIINKLWGLILALSFIVFFSVYMLYVQAVISGRFTISSVLLTILLTVSNLAIVIFTITLAYIFDTKKLPVITNPFFGRIGEYSMEVYAFQGIVLRELARHITKKASFILTSVAVIFLISFLFHTLKTLITKSLANKCRDRNR